MGPTIQQNNALDFAMEYTKNHTVQLKIQVDGAEDVINKLNPQNKLTVVEKTFERANNQQLVELFQLGRMNFKK